MWCLVLMVLFSFPTSGNISWPFMLITVVGLVVYYFAWARDRFKGPQRQGDEGALTEIEKEFQRAAGELAEAWRRAQSRRAGRTIRRPVIMSVRAEESGHEQGSRRPR